MAMGVYPQAQGVPEHLHVQLLGSHSAAPIDYIEAAERERDVDEKTVALLMESIEATGLQQPIGVRRVNGSQSVRLVWGRQRLEAFRRKWQVAADAGDEKGMGRWGRIPAIVYPAEMTDALASLLEVQENLDRGDLTTDQRKAWAARRGELMLKVNPQKKADGKKTKSTNPEEGFSANGTKPQGGRPGGWFAEWFEDARIPKKTAHNWWSEFKSDTGETRTPAKAEDRRADFFDWLQKKREPTPKAKSTPTTTDQVESYEQKACRIARSIDDAKAAQQRAVLDGLESTKATVPTAKQAEHAEQLAKAREAEIEDAEFEEVARPAAEPGDDADARAAQQRAVLDGLKNAKATAPTVPKLDNGNIDIDEYVARLADDVKAADRAKLKRAAQQLFTDLVEEFKRELASALREKEAETKRAMQAAYELEQKAKAEYEAATQYRLGVDSHMTQDEFKLVLSCLHPDKQPEEVRPRYDRAFEIFKRLEKTVNTKLPIAELRRRGWDKVSPFYKGPKAREATP